MKENQPAKKKKKPVDPSRSLIVIGGGAAGLMAAVQAAKAGAFVTLLEHNEKTGRKIAVTGNIWNIQKNIYITNCHYGVFDLLVL